VIPVSVFCLGLFLSTLITSGSHSGKISHLSEMYNLHVSMTKSLTICVDYFVCCDVMSCAAAATAAVVFVSG